MAFFTITPPQQASAPGRLRSHPAPPHRPHSSWQHDVPNAIPVVHVGSATSMTRPLKGSDTDIVEVALCAWQSPHSTSFCLYLFRSRESNPRKCE